LVALKEGKEMNKEAFVKTIKQWEWHWVKERKDYPVITKGNCIAIAKELFSKYRQKI